MSTLPLQSLSDSAWTVGQVARAARRMVEGGMGALWIRGEICGLKVYQSGHWYFSLRDQEAQIRCTMWRTYSSKAGPAPADGTQVFLFAAPTVWEEKGEFRLNVLQLLATEGLGRQYLAFERVKALLQRDGLFEPARKRALPSLPLRIAVVTSLDGAALRDIITVARKRWPSVQLVVIGSKVQGAEAEAELVRALRLVNRLDGLDLCIVGRGGGGQEDLAAFNTEAVCRALAAVRVPTISAVGHETDVSLTDFVADARAATPSAAIELAVPDAAEALARVAVLAERLAGTMGRTAQIANQRLGRTADRLQSCLDRMLERRRLELDGLASRLDAISPLRVLERGYSVAVGLDGRILKRRSEFIPGSSFTLRVSDGDVGARVESQP